MASQQTNPLDGDDSNTKAGKTAAKPPQDDWSVIDTLAIHGPREHDVGGVMYPLSARAATKMPKSHALVFLCDGAFKVFDPSGALIKPLPKATKVAATGGIILQPGQCLARVDELNDDALRNRVAQLGGIEPHIIAHGSRADFIRIMLEDQERIRAGASDRIASDAQIEGMSQSEMDSLLGVRAA